MKKVVFNNDFGGFGLSQDALILLLLAGFELPSMALDETSFKAEDFTLISPHGMAAHPHESMVLKDGRVYDDSLFCGNDRQAAALRSHPMLLSVVQVLGAAAGSPYSGLAIAEIPDGARYRIAEHAGREQVVVLDPDNYVSGFEASSAAGPLPDPVAAVSYQRLPAPPKEPTELEPWSAVWAQTTAPQGA